MTTWTMRQAQFCLIGSTCFTLAVFFMGYSFWMHSKKGKLQCKDYQITAIIQTGPEKEALKTCYLAELLELSIDKPTNLYAFDVKKGEEKLLASPLIESAHIRKVLPNILYIDYEVKKPLAWLGDYQNVAVDKNGYLFPMVPFFSPKELPEIYLGLPAFSEGEDGKGRKGGLWKTPLENPYFSLAMEILHFLEGSPWREGLRIKRIDVSNAFSPSLGTREIVLFTEEDVILHKEGDSCVCVFPKMLRLSPKEYVPQMNNFLTFRKNMLEDYKKQLSSAQPLPSGRFSPRIVDLRIPHLAFVEN